MKIPEHIHQILFNKLAEMLEERYAKLIWSWGCVPLHIHDRLFHLFIIERFCQKAFL